MDEWSATERIVHLQMFESPLMSATLTHGSLRLLDLQDFLNRDSIKDGMVMLPIYFFHRTTTR